MTPMKQKAFKEVEAKEAVLSSTVQWKKHTKRNGDRAHRLKDLKRYKPIAKYRPYIDPNSNNCKKENEL